MSADLIRQAIATFNADDRQTHRSNPDSREHRYARLPILATDCDYEIAGFSGVQGVRLTSAEIQAHVAAQLANGGAEKLTTAMRKAARAGDSFNNVDWSWKATL